MKFDGWVSLNKEPGKTSRKALNEVCKLLGTKKAGYAGTLDPFASGVLPIAVGRATKVLEYFMKIDKEYSFTAQFGIRTDTDDITGQVIEEVKTEITKEQIEDIINEYIGLIDQTPPKYSAIKIDGKRAYDLARNNQEFEIKPRKIQIYDLKLISFDYETQQARFWTHCGKGTYIRSLVMQIATRLGAIATTTQLHRGRFGKFNEKNTFLLDKLEFLLHNARLEGCIFPVDYVLDDIPAVQISELEASKLKSGQAIERFSMNDMPQIRLLHDNKIIAIGNLYSNLIKPLKIIEI